jgi:hypothetical protein
LVATLNHSTLPTLVVEGDDDVIVFRRLENSAPNLALSVLPVGGRDQVFAIYGRRTEIRGKQKLAFVADLDLWVFSNVPQQYVSNDLLFTDGYSIENDAFRDGLCHELLLRAERADFERDLEIFSEWFALAVSRGLSIDTHPNQLLDDSEQRNALMKLKPQETYPQNIFDLIKSDYLRYIRGKSLFQLFQRQMKGRSVKYSQTSLLEMAAAKPGRHIQSLFDRASAILQT